MKKIALTLGALATTVAVLPMFAAFEAHVINVTARIENALSVPLEHLDFGTVFPQEQLDKPFDVSLSQSFLDEKRVDDVEYIIRQKPKCGVTTDKGEILVGPTATGHVIPDNSTDLGYRIDCGDDPREVDADGSPLPDGSTWGVLPLLCPYLSKHELTDDSNAVVAGNDADEDVPAFHIPFVVDPNTGSTTWTEAVGYLSKLDGDTSDTWNIDLKVPCFGNHCAQDWESFVRGINDAADLDPNDYIQPIENEHKVFGCDLWIEVTGVSETPTT